MSGIEGPGIVGGGGGGAPSTEDFVTFSTEVALPNSRVLTAGTNVTLSTATPGQVIVNSSAGGGSAVPTTVQGDTLYASAVNTLSALAKDTNATRYVANTGTSNNPAWAQVNLANGVTGDLPFANLTQGSSLSVLGVTGNVTADNASIAAASDDQVLRRSGTAVAFGAVNLAAANAITGDLPFSSLAQGSALSVLGVTGNVTADNASIAAATDTQVLRRAGTAVAFGAVDLTSANAVSGILPAANGGTANGFTAITGPTTATKTFTLPDASATILTSAAAVTVAQGGTGLAAGTSGGVPYYSATNTIASSGALAATAVVLGGGAGAAPTTDADFTWTAASNTMTVGTAATPATIIAPTNAGTGAVLTVRAGPSTGAGNVGGTLTLLGGLPADGGGGPILLTGGAGIGTARNGGAVTITGGAGGTTGNGSDVIVNGGSATDGNGGNVTVGARAGVGTNRDGGAFGASGGAGTGSGNGGAAALTAGRGGATGTAGEIAINGGAGGTTSGAGGIVRIFGGAPVDGNGGDINLSAADGVGTNRSGGNLNLTVGAKTGSGVIGSIVLTNATQTGAQTATFTATNKPGSGTTAPSLWLRVVVGATTYYMPMWQ